MGIPKSPRLTHPHLSSTSHPHLSSTSHTRISLAAGLSAPRTTPPNVRPGRHHCLLLLTAATRNLAAIAQDIPLFGLRKNLSKAEVIVREGEKALEKGIETVEVGIEKAEKEIVTAEREIETVASLGVAGGLAQAGVVTGVEVDGVFGGFFSGEWDSWA